MSRVPSGAFPKTPTNPTTVDENTTSGQRQRVFRATFPTVGQHTLQIVAGTGFQVDALTTTQY